MATGVGERTDSLQRSLEIDGVLRDSAFFEEVLGLPAAPAGRVLVAVQFIGWRALAVQGGHPAWTEARRHVAAGLRLALPTRALVGARGNMTFLAVAEGVPVEAVTTRIGALIAELARPRAILHLTAPIMVDAEVLPLADQRCATLMDAVCRAMSLMLIGPLASPERFPDPRR